MVRDGYFYGIGCAVAAALIIWLAAWPYAIPLILLGAFCLWFFRDPEREIPSLPGAFVSPGDGKVTEVAIIRAGSGSAGSNSTGVAGNSAGSVRDRTRISIFLNVFDVHVNRSPIAGVIRDVRYQRGKFLNAMAADSAEANEQNIVTVEGEGRTVIFKQIAGLIARRIVCNINIGDRVARGQRVGLIKFGSRVDVVFDSDAVVQVKVGDRVKGGATVLAVLPLTVDRKSDRQADGKGEPVSAGAEREVSSTWKS